MCGVCTYVPIQPNEMQVLNKRVHFPGRRGSVYMCVEFYGGTMPGIVDMKKFYNLMGQPS